jgi:hypothetical protein
MSLFAEIYIYKKNSLIYLNVEKYYEIFLNRL